MSVEEQREVLSVGEATRAISAALEWHLPAQVWVRGEVNGVRQGRGNTYFDLVETDAGGTTVAKLPVAVLSWQRRGFDADLAAAGLDLEGGMDVLVSGPVTFWGKGGQLRLEALRVDPAYTLGVIARRRREVLERIAAEGLTRHNARHALPPAPLRVGLVAAEGSAAAADVRR
ncbi:MAG: exodeoxyribonuclease VII large subunit, partial [Egibacteraceae bacterium]